MPKTKKQALNVEKVEFYRATSTDGLIVANGLTVKEATDRLSEELKKRGKGNK